MADLRTPPASSGPRSNVAQMVERQVEALRVGGSNPPVAVTLHGGRHENGMQLR